MLDQLGALWTTPALWFLGIVSEKAASTRDEAGGLHSPACQRRNQKASGILRAPFSCCGDTRPVDQLTTVERVSTHVQSLEDRLGMTNMQLICGLDSDSPGRSGVTGSLGHATL